MTAPSIKTYTVARASLTDFGGSNLQPGIDPWALEKESQTLESDIRKPALRLRAPRCLES